MCLGCTHSLCSHFQNPMATMNEVLVRHVLGELHELFDPPGKKRRAAAAECWVMQARGLTLKQRYELCCQRREPAAASDAEAESGLESDSEAESGLESDADSEATRAFESSEAEAVAVSVKALGGSRNTKVAVYVAAPAHDDDGEGPDGPDQ